MNNMELSLVLFTVLGQTAVGLAVISSVRQWATAGGEGGQNRAEWMTAGLFLAVGLIASLFHLGHPLGAPRAIVHLATSWLSREVLGYMVFGLLIIWLFLIVRKNQAQGWLVKVAALVGLIALFFSAMAYSPPSFPALNNGLPFVFFLLTAFILGSAVGSYFAPEDRQPLLIQILATSLIVGLVVYLLVPCIWWSGGTVMRQTAQTYAYSPVYWIRVLAGLGVPLLVLWKLKRIPVWLPVWLLAGEILGRIMFFTHVPHAITNIGGLY